MKAVAVENMMNKQAPISKYLSIKNPTIAPMKLTEKQITIITYHL
jgi:hypothetical protein